jgi:hypothetical protein
MMASRKDVIKCALRVARGKSFATLTRFDI